MICQPSDKLNGMIQIIESEYQKAFPNKSLNSGEAALILADALYAAFAGIIDVRRAPPFRLDSLIEIAFDNEGNRRPSEEVFQEQRNFVQYSILEIATQRVEGKALQNWNPNSEN